MKWLDLGHYHVSLELWLNAKREYHMVALGGSPESRALLKELGGEEQTVFKSHEGGASAVLFPPASGRIASEEWLARFPEAKLAERELDDILKVRPAADGAISNQVIQDVIQRSEMLLAAVAEEERLRREAEAAIPFFAEPSLPPIPEFDAPVVATSTPTSAAADAGFDSHVVAAGEQPAGELPGPAPQNDSAGSTFEQASVAAQEIVEPEQPREPVLSQWISSLHADDDRALVEVAHGLAGLTPEKMAEILGQQPSSLMLRGRGLSVSIQLLEAMPTDSRAVLTVLGNAQGLIDQINELQASRRAWPIVGAVWGKPRESDAMIVLMLDGTLPESAWIKQLSVEQMRQISSEAEMGAYINEIWRTTYGQATEIVSAPAPVQAPRGADDLGDDAGRGAVPPVRGSSERGGVASADGRGTRAPVADGAGRGGNDARGSRPAGGDVLAGNERGAAAGRVVEPAGAGQGAAEPGANDRNAGRDDRGVSRRQPRRGRPDDEQLGRGGEQEVPAGGGTERQDAVRARTRRADRKDRQQLISEETADDRRQTYIPGSRIPAQGTMVPLNLASPVRRALEKVVAEYGDIDQFVGERLGFDIDGLIDRFYAEQVDALALALRCVDNSRGFVLGDMTGIGKGRVLAGLARYGVRQDMRVVFVTDRPPLFNSMAREIAVMGTHHLINQQNLLVINSGEVVTSEMGDELCRGLPTEEVRELIERGVVPDDVKLVFLTHSQLSHAATPGSKAEWIINMSRGAMLLIDESHLSAGTDSHCGRNLRAMRDNARAQVFSSATFAKEAKNLSLYSTTDLGLIPGGEVALLDQLQRGGAAAQESIPVLLAEEGQYVRREHDLSQAIYRNLDASPEHFDAIRERMDAISRALRHMLAVQSIVSGLAARYNTGTRNPGETAIEAAGRTIGLQSNHFSSGIHHFTSQALLAVQADAFADAAIASLRNNEKPVFMFKSTMDAVIGDMAQMLMEQDINPEGARIETSFAQVLRRMAERALKVRLDARNGRGTFLINLLDPVAQMPRGARANDVFTALLDRVQLDLQQEMIAFEQALEAIPNDVPLSPIDHIRERIEAAGYSVGELTGRTWKLSRMSATEYQLNRRTDGHKRQRQGIINAYNSGAANALLLNKVGATGIDLHADLRFQDQRLRNMFMVDFDDDINVVMQTMGRVYRANQAQPPAYSMWNSPIPVSRRPMAVLRRKLANLMAQTRGSREVDAADQVPDLFNWVGDEVALDYLRNNPDIARRLDIELGREEERLRNGNGGLVNRLTGLALLLPCDAQEDLFDDLEDAYVNKIESLLSRGISPFHSRHLDIKAAMVDEVEVEARSGSSVFQAPVSLRKLRYEIDVHAFRSDELAQILERNRENLTVAGGASQEFGDRPLEVVLNTVRATLRERQQQTFDLFLHERFGSIEEAVASEHDNAVAKSEQTLNAFEMIAPNLQIGAAVQLDVGRDAPLVANVVGIFPARSSLLHSLVSWEVQLVSPDTEYRSFRTGLDRLVTDATLVLQREKAQLAEGEEFTRTLADVMFVPELDLPRVYDAGHPAYQRYDQAASGKLEIERFMLCGNLLRAIEIARSESKGLPCSFTLADGTREQGVLMPADYDGVALLRRPVVLDDAELAVVVIRRMHERKHAKSYQLPVEVRDSVVENARPTLESRLSAADFTVKVTPTGDNYAIELHVPRAQRKSGWLVKDAELKDLAAGADWEKAGGDLKLALVRFSLNDIRSGRAVGLLDPVLRRLTDLGVSVKTPEKLREAREWKNEFLRQRAAEPDLAIAPQAPELGA